MGLSCPLWIQRLICLLIKDTLLQRSGCWLMIIVGWELLVRFRICLFNKLLITFFSIWARKSFDSFLRSEIWYLWFIIFRLIELGLRLLRWKLMHWWVQRIRERIQNLRFTGVRSVGEAHRLIWSKSWVVLGEEHLGIVWTLRCSRFVKLAYLSRWFGLEFEWWIS